MLTFRTLASRPDPPSSRLGLHPVVAIHVPLEALVPVFVNIMALTDTDVRVQLNINDVLSDRPDRSAGRRAHHAS
jgi:hypothetical protein